MRETTRRQLLASGAVATVGALAGCVGGLGGSGDGNGGGDGAGGGTPAWRTTELTDVRTDETFTVEELPKPMLLETFAVWCSKCFAQQENLRTFHERNPDVPSVALNTDPNEDTDKVRRHAEENGFDWRYAVSPAAVTDSLVSQFGPSMTTPPQVPKVRVCESGATRLSGGVKSADWLADAVEECSSA